MHKPYDEKLIVDNFHELYRLLIQLGYFKSEDILFPGHERHSINEELCQELNLSQEVVSLMKKLPYPVDGYHKPILWQSRAFEYYRDEDILNGRDPEQADTGNELRKDFLLPHEIALTCWLDDGISVILDTKENTIRVIDESDPVHNYRESHACDAPTYIQQIVENIHSLEYVYKIDAEYVDQPGSYNQIQMKRILIEDFNWGTNFREEAWKEQGPEICQRIIDESLADSGYL
ncbi:hypothetical protein N7493_009221 [Penicillium malachiteum]|uniref:Uncharacterized protein n=1 Tax=Penicillium malachiteum TaxID=1324776 RepID=A0AAD6HG72_9EURO|nr:hypothetical protein N7493_009221 [Penicillium malachiteum]